MATRNLSPEVVALISAKKLLPAVFIYADFPLGAKFIWTGRGPYIDDEANTWTGTGTLISIDAIQESIDTGAKGLKITLDGLDQDLINELVSQPYSGRDAEVLLGFFDPITQRVVFMDEPIWKGKLDTDDMSKGENDAQLTILCEHRMADVTRKREIRYTHEDQQYLYPGEDDAGLKEIEVIQERTTVWGRAQQ